MDQQKQPMLFDNLKWVTTKEAAFLLRRSVGAIYILVSRNKLRARKLHGKLYFNKDEILDMLNASQLRGGIHGN